MLTGEGNAIEELLDERSHQEHTAIGKTYCQRTGGGMNLPLTAAVLTCHQCTVEHRHKCADLGCQSDGHPEYGDLGHA